MSRFPRRLNLQGGVPIWRPATALQIEALRDQARAAGLDVTITADRKVVVHGACRPTWNRHTRTTTCRQGDVWLLDAATVAGLVQDRETCAEHAAVAV